MPDAMDSVRVVNVGDKPFRGVFQKRATTIQPGGVAFVPWPAACTWFGNPTLRNTETSKQREAEFKHLLAKYGVYHHIELASELLPRCEVYDLNNERIFMVLDDPDGKRALDPPPTDASSTESQVLQRRLYELENQQKAMLDVLTHLDPEAAAKLAAAFGHSVPAGADAVPAGATSPTGPAAGATGSAPAPLTGPPSSRFISAPDDAIDTQPPVGDTELVGAAPTDGPTRVKL